MEFFGFDRSPDSPTDKPVQDDKDEPPTHDGTLWEIDLGSEGTTKSKKQMPKFLRERQKEQEKLRMERLKKDVTSPVKKASPSPEKQKTRTPQSAKSTPPDKRSVTGKGTALVRPSSRTGNTDLKTKITPPAIKQPLFLVKSKRKTPDPQSSSAVARDVNSPTTVRASSKTPTQPSSSSSPKASRSRLFRMSPGKPQKSPKAKSSDSRSESAQMVFNQTPESSSVARDPSNVGMTIQESIDGSHFEEESKSYSPEVADHDQTEGAAALRGGGGSDTTPRLKYSNRTYRKQPGRRPLEQQATPTSHELATPPQHTQAAAVALSAEPFPAQKPQDMATRKVLDLRRWYCICRPQHTCACGISSVISCWNYLFSTLGTGSLPPVTQGEALTSLGYSPPFSEIHFGSFTSNTVIMKWFQDLCCHYGVHEQSYFFYKPVGGKGGGTFDLTPDSALRALKEGLAGSSLAFVYHSHKHYFSPIGFEDVPKLPADAYNVNLRPEQVETWFLVGETNRKKLCIHCIKWDDIVIDLNCSETQFFDVRNTEQGIQTRDTKRSEENKHCIMAFKKLDHISNNSSSELTTSSFHDRTKGPVSACEQDSTASKVEDLKSVNSDFAVDSSSNAATSQDDKLKELDARLKMLESAWLQSKEGLAKGAIHPPSGDDIAHLEDVDGVADEGDGTLTTSVDLSSSSGVSIPSIEVTKVVATSDKRSPGPHRRRGAVMKKKRSSLSPVRQPHNNDYSSESDQDATSSPQMRDRSETYTLRSSEDSLQMRDRSETYTLKSSEGSSHMRDRSETFTLKSLSSSSEAQPSSTELDPGSYETLAGGGGGGAIRRSGTFTKEKPTVIVEKRRQDSEYDDSAQSSADNESVDGEPDSASSAAQIRRSGTFTKEKPAILVAQQPRESDGETLSDFDAVDLDETLKALDAIENLELAEGSCNDEESGVEV